MKNIFLLFLFILIIFSCDKSKKKESFTKIIEKKVSLKYQDEYIAKKFDFPVGKPNAKGYYNAQKFGKNFHLGDDWNSVKGGNSDLGDPIYAVANGYIKFAKDVGGGWGNVIRIDHKLPNGKIIESLYAHCNSILLTKGTWVKRGDKIGTIGNANGQYFAHLHLEVRDDINLPIGKGYSENTKGYIDPTKFIKEN